LNSAKILPNTHTPGRNPRTRHVRRRTRTKPEGAENRITNILKGRRAVTADTALRFGHWFGMSAEFWLNLQKQYELRLAEKLNGAEIRRLPRNAA
jgi:hypothetical protein